MEAVQHFFLPFLTFSPKEYDRLAYAISRSLSIYDSPTFLWVVGISGVIAVVINMLVFTMLYPLSKIVEGNFKSNPIYRPFSHILMGFYVPFVSPFVTSAILVYYHHFTSKWLEGFSHYPQVQGLVMGISYWGVGALHGIFIDYSCYKMERTTALYFQLSTFILYSLQGAIVVYLLHYFHSF